jgi:hypothetical protein
MSFAFERDPAAVASATARAERVSFSNVRFVQGDAQASRIRRARWAEPRGFRTKDVRDMLPRSPRRKSGK